MSNKADHAQTPPGAAGIERQSEKGRQTMAENLATQEAYYRAKRDFFRADDCKRERQELQS